MVTNLLAESKIPTTNQADTIELKSKVNQLEGFKKIILRSNDVLLKEIGEMKAEIEARDTRLEAFKLMEFVSNEKSQQAEISKFKLNISMFKLRKSKS